MGPWKEIKTRLALDEITEKLIDVTAVAVEKHITHPRSTTNPLLQALVYTGSQGPTG